jgi:hypothetical protein
METQLWIHETEPKAEKLRPVQNDMFGKPVGGFWTSTFLGPEELSDWYRYARNYGVSKDDLLWKLIPGEAKLRVIDSAEDAIRFVDEYGTDAYPDMPARCIRQYQLDFERAAQEYDGVHLTSRGLQQAKMPPFWNDGEAGTLKASKAFTFGGWDCESTLWFRWKFTHVERLHIGRG